MNTNVKGKTALRGGKDNLGRSQAIFIAVGLVIVLGGLWLLYSGSGPYHP